MKSVRETIDEFVIPAQKESFEGSIDDRRPAQSRESSKVRAEAVAECISRAIGEEAREGNLAVVGSMAGEESWMDPARKKQRIERLEGKDRLIHFLADDDTLSRLDQYYLETVSDTISMPPEFELIWDFDGFRSVYEPDSDENDVYLHLQSTIVLTLQFLVDRRYGLFEPDIQVRRWKRAKRTSSSDTRDGRRIS